MLIQNIFSGRLIVFSQASYLGLHSEMNAAGGCSGSVHFLATYWERVNINPMNHSSYFSKWRWSWWMYSTRNIDFSVEGWTWTCKLHSLEDHDILCINIYMFMLQKITRVAAILIHSTIAFNPHDVPCDMDVVGMQSFLTCRNHLKNQSWSSPVVKPKGVLHLLSRQQSQTSEFDSCLPDLEAVMLTLASVQNPLLRKVINE